MHNNAEAVFVWASHNAIQLKTDLMPILLQKQELLADPCNAGLELDIEKQYVDAMRSELAHRIGNALNLNAEAVLMYVEDINLDELMK